MAKVVSQETVRELLGARVAVLLVRSPGCSHCEAFKPKFEAEARRQGEGFWEVFSAEARTLLPALKVDGVPTTFVLSRGAVQATTLGDVSADELRATVSRGINRAVYS